MVVQSVIQHNERNWSLLKNQGRKTKIDKRNAVCTNAEKKKGDSWSGVWTGRVLGARFPWKANLSEKVNENLSARQRVRFRDVAGREQTSAADERPTFWKRERASIGVVGWHSEQKSRTYLQQRSRRTCQEILGCDRSKGCCHPRRVQPYIPEDFAFLPENQQMLICKWCFPRPVLGFNRRRYDLNLIKKLSTLWHTSLNPAM